MHLPIFRPAFCLLLGLFVALLGASARAQVTINEVMAANASIALPDGAISDFVELHNPGAQPVSLAGWSLTDTVANPRRWTIPSNVSLAAKGFLVIALDSARPPSSAAGFGMNAGFSIKGDGDLLHLYTAASALADSIQFGPQAADYALGAIPSGSENFVLCTPTPGSENIAQALGPQSALRINEWMADPSSGDDWFELYNPGTLPVQLTGLYFADSNLEPSPVAPLSFIGTGKIGFVRFYADNSTNFNEVDFGLGAGGDSIGLYGPGGARIDQVTFGAQTEDRSEGRLPDGASTVQKLNLATPSGSNLVLYEGLVVNEVLAHTDPPYEDAVEFLNLTASPIDIGGWFLSNERSDLQKFKVPSGTVVPAGGYFVFYEQQFNSAGAARPFTFNSAQGDRVVLSQAAPSGALTGYIVEAEFDASERNISFGRHPLSVPNAYVFTPLQAPSFGVTNPESLAQFRAGLGGPNFPPKTGPVVITEIMYNPSTNTASADSPSDPDEFVELTNLSSAPVALYDPEHPDNVWKIGGGIGYSFRRFSSIPAHSSILLVSFDPDVQASLAAAFRAKYAVPSGVPLHGPFSGKLGNSGEPVILLRPDQPQDASHPDAGFVPYLLVDRVDYLDSAPWPPAADGAGSSLQKTGTSLFGNDPAHWTAAAPTAGSTPSSAPPAIKSIALASGKVTFTFDAYPLRSYLVQYRSTLGPAASWQLLQVVSEQTPRTVTIARDASSRTEFYRVVNGN